MRIRVSYDDGTVGDYDSLEAAKVEILEQFAAGALPDQVVEVDEDDNELRYFGCTWDVTLEEISEANTE